MVSTTNKVSTYATGFRNCYDCHYTQAKKLICTDNGPNPNNYGDPQVSQQPGGWVEAG